MVLDDLNLIIRDIREAHKKDSESAPQTTVADELKENLSTCLNCNCISEIVICNDRISHMGTLTERQHPNRVLPFPSIL